MYGFIAAVLSEWKFRTCLMFILAVLHIPCFWIGTTNNWSMVGQEMQHHLVERIQCNEQARKVG